MSPKAALEATIKNNMRSIREWEATTGGYIAVQEKTHDNEEWETLEREISYTLNRISNLKAEVRALRAKLDSLVECVALVAKV